MTCAIQPDPELQPALARLAFNGLVTLCDCAVPGTEIAVHDIGAMLRLIGQAAAVDPGADRD